MPAWGPGVLSGLLAETANAGRAGQRKGLLTITASIEAMAKAKLGETSHRYGTRSPAQKGGPPSLVSGTGRRSIGHDYVTSVEEAVVKIGTAAGVFPPAQTSSTGKGTRSRAKAGTTGSRGTTPSSKYLLYQETVGKFDHPFLKPSYDAVVTETSVAVWLSSFTWPKI